MISEKTLYKLEFQSILQQLSVYCKSSLSTQRVLSLRPSEDFESAQKMLEETNEAYNFFAFETSFDFSIDDITETAHLAKISSALSMGQLLSVMRLLKISRRLKKIFSENNAAKVDLLRQHTQKLYCDVELENEIDFAIISEEEMNDKASNELFSIRKKIKQINADIQSKLVSYTRQGELSKYLQDAVVTVRNGRYVIPVKQEYKANVHGIVHDQSSSGATFFVEPMAIIELNNQLRTAILSEAEEIQRILAAFTRRISPFSDRLVVNQEVIVHLDVLFSKVKYALDLKATKPELNNDGVIKLRNARHPLIDKKKIVPISIELGKDFDIVVVTGPNTGGKTVSLKTTGLMCLLAMSGMYIPASEGSQTSFFQKIFCDIGDEQSIEQSLSTFSSHIVNIRDILTKCDSKTLVLIDEVGAGTEPNEGTALALAITEFLRNSHAKCVITTHYGQLKEYSLTTDRVENASMEFNPETFEPTYRLIVGVPGSSNAIAIASKLGLQKSVIEFAQSNLSSEKTALDKALQNADILRRKFEEQQQEIQETRAELQRELLRTKNLNDNLSKEREMFLSSAKSEAKKVVEQAEEQAKELIEQIKELLNSSELQEKSLFEARSLAKQIKNSKFAHISDDESDELVFSGDNVDFEKLKEGDTVFCDKLQSQVKVVSIRSFDKINVQAGAIKTTVSASNLFYCKVESNINAKHKTDKQSKTKIDTRTFKNEINVIGQTVEEAVANVDCFLDSALQAGFATVWVIHGMGTGRLRQGLHQFFKIHPRVLEFRLGKFGEGESGVTVVTLK